MDIADGHFQARRGIPFAGAAEQQVVGLQQGCPVQHFAAQAGARFDLLAQTGIMEEAPRRLMGRTQSAFSILSTVLQVLMSLTLGYFAQNLSLPLAFFVLGLLYGCAVLAAIRARELELPRARGPAEARAS